jgi:putative oxidoreductase
MKLFNRILMTEASWSVILVRFMVGWVFWSEGVQKFLYPDTLGIGRFIHIGIPFPEIMAPFVGVVEISCGFLFVIGLLTRLASIPLIINISVAIASTKIPILIKNGFWAMSHEGRTDLCMILGLMFFLIIGAGSWSFDSLLAKKICSENT